MNQISPVIVFSLLCCVWPAIWFAAGWWFRGHQIIIISKERVRDMSGKNQAPYTIKPNQ